MSQHTTGSDLTAYSFEGRDIRVVRIADEPWFVASDAAAMLGYREAYDLTRVLDDDEKGPHRVRTPGGDQEVSIISEAGLYRAIVQRRATSAVPAEIRDGIVRFQRWVFHDVLPSIRKTGSYGGPSITAADLLANPKQLLAITQGYALQIEDMKRDMVVMQQDVDALDRLAGLEGNFGIRQSAKALSMPERKFTEYVQRIRWCFRQRGTNYLMGYAEKDRAGYLTHKLEPYTRPDGSEAVRETLRFKPAGLVRLAKMLNVTLNLEETLNSAEAA